MERTRLKRAAHTQETHNLSRHAVRTKQAQMRHCTWDPGDGNTLHCCCSAQPSTALREYCPCRPLWASASRCTPHTLTPTRMWVAPHGTSAAAHLGVGETLGCSTMGHLQAAACSSNHPAACPCMLRATVTPGTSRMSMCQTTHTPTKSMVRANDAACT